MADLDTAPPPMPSAALWELAVVVLFDGIMRIMSLTIEIVPDLELGGYTARLPDIPAYGEGETEEEAIVDLKEALRGYIETFGLEDARNRISQPALRTIELDLVELTSG